ncbi:hypothetical protein CDCA_CDCA04G1275 [Cyanidium caldarium]|uniref:non-specific serine/threonine protein kinase n=1 Tax=Cyanidium caldarium TaxID=2771 RepID=A0AAV9ISH5_CYACA|nr:hypothetical protein CDCA_CDCA04G1275 [Cyanidium caldarium]
MAPDVNKSGGVWPGEEQRPAPLNLPGADVGVEGPALPPSSGGGGADDGDGADDADTASASGFDDELEYTDVEDLEDYRKGGYHLVQVGDAFKGGRYVVLRKVGWGHFSTVWLCWDRERGELVALKVQKSARHYTEAAWDEVALLLELRKRGADRDVPVVRLLDRFEHAGANGVHVCMVFEVLGKSLLSLIRKYKYRGAPVKVVRQLSRQLLVALDYCHRLCNIIHTDVKPENCLLVPPAKASMELAVTAIEDALEEVETEVAMVGEAHPVTEADKSDNALAADAEMPVQMLRSGDARTDVDGPAAAPTKRSAPTAVSTPNAKGAGADTVEQLSRELTQQTLAESIAAKGAPSPPSARLHPSPAPTIASVRTRRVNRQKQWATGPSATTLQAARTSSASRLERARRVLQDSLAHATAALAHLRGDAQVAPDAIADSTQPPSKEPGSAELSTPPTPVETAEPTLRRQPGPPGVISRMDDLRRGMAAAATERSAMKTATRTPHRSATRTDSTDSGADRSVPPVPPAPPPSDRSVSTASSTSGLRRRRQRRRSHRIDRTRLPTRPVAWDGWEMAPCLKLVDFGNACWIHKHFTEDIQTRQYRSPEVILGAGYDTSADMWSCACMIFELLTGDFLFDPHSGRSFDRDEDHLGLAVELLGDIPLEVLNRGKYTREYFNRHGKLRNIKKLNFWSLEDVLHEKYKFAREEADAIADFLKPMLRLNPKERVTAAQALQHPWLQSDGEKRETRGDDRWAETEDDDDVSPPAMPPSPVFDDLALERCSGDSCRPVTVMAPPDNSAPRQTLSPLKQRAVDDRFRGDVPADASTSTASTTTVRDVASCDGMMWSDGNYPAGASTPSINPPLHATTVTANKR